MRDVREPVVLCERTEAPRFYSLTQIEDEATLSRKWAAGAHFGASDGA